MFDVPSLAKIFAVLVGGRDQLILICFFFFPFFFPAILFFLTYYSQYFAHQQFNCLHKE